MIKISHVSRPFIRRGNLFRNLSLATALAGSLNGCPPGRGAYVIPTSVPTTFLSPSPIIDRTPSPSPIITLSPASTLTPTPYPSPKITPTLTPSPIATIFPSPNITPIPTSTPTSTPIPVKTFSPNPTPTPAPSHWPISSSTVNWEEIAPPPIKTNKFIYYGNNIFAMSDKALHKSSDNGTSWQEITLNLSNFTGTSFYDFDIDKDKIWIACGRGIAVSDNLNGNFSSFFYWNWDPTVSIDMQDGYGWYIISSWGSASGIGGIGRPYAHGNYDWNGRGTIIADPLDPANVAYFNNNSYTIDGGANWEKMPYGRGSAIINFTTVWDGKSVLFSGSTYSDNHGMTWQDTGLNGSVFFKASDQFYAYGTDRANQEKSHFFTGTPNNWIDHGPIDLDGYTIPIATNSLIFSYTKDNKFFRGTWQK